MCLRCSPERCSAAGIRSSAVTKSPEPGFFADPRVNVRSLIEKRLHEVEIVCLRLLDGAQASRVVTGPRSQQPGGGDPVGEWTVDHTCVTFDDSEIRQFCESARIAFAFDFDGTVVSGRYRAVGPWRPYRDHALAMPRQILDGLLADRLRVLPVDFRERVKVTDVLVEGGRVGGVEASEADGRPQRFRAPLVVAADGRASVVAHRLGLRRPHRLARMALVTYATDVEGVTDRGEIYVDPPDYAILNPVGPGVVNLSVVVPLAHAAPFSGRLDTFFAARVKRRSSIPCSSSRRARSRASERARSPCAIATCTSSTRRSK